MILYLRKVFRREEPQPTTAVSAFFKNASAREKKRMFTEAIRKANRGQRELIERYDRMHTKTAA